jgi:hypothetical protein
MAQINQGGEALSLAVKVCEELPVGAVWLKTAISSASNLGDSFGPISVEAS